MQESRRSDGEHVLLGRILVEAGYMNEDQLLDALKDQGVRVMSCPSCGSRFNLITQDNQAYSICASCGTPVQPAAPDAALEINGEILPVGR